MASQSPQIKTTSLEIVNQFRKINITVALTRQNLGAEFFLLTHFSAPRHLQGQPRLFQKSVVEESPQLADTATR
jgi:hypothetical protein